MWKKYYGQKKCRFSFFQLEINKFTAKQVEVLICSRKYLKDWQLKANRKYVMMKMSSFCLSEGIKSYYCHNALQMTDWWAFLIKFFLWPTKWIIPVLNIRMVFIDDKEQEEWVHSKMTTLSSSLLDSLSVKVNITQSIKPGVVLQNVISKGRNTTWPVCFIVQKIKDTCWNPFLSDGSQTRKKKYVDTFDQSVGERQINKMRRCGQAASDLKLPCDS